MAKYDPQDIEKKWQKKWDKDGTFEVKEDPNKEKFYALIEFPYPSGAGLHVGHPRPFTAMDVIARKKRMQGFNVLYPIGFDAFGLPTENYAIKTGRPPAEVTAENIATFTRQLKSLGYSFDWSRSVDTTDPNYYKWTQWIFLQLFKHGLAYKKNQPINWCPKDKIGLANEEVVQGCCERCDTPVEQRNKDQWMLAITKYADKLLNGLSEVDYITPARVQQENWIGKSEGAEIKFKLVILSGAKDILSDLAVFTTRPDTLFGVTFVAVSAELAKKWLAVGWKASDAVKKYIEATLAEQKTAAGDREEKAKTGVDAGIKAVNPATGEEIPVWITNYVMGGVGTGAIMGVPAHDERDFEFAKKFGLPIKQVIAPHIVDPLSPPRSDKKTVPRTVVQGIVKHWDKDEIIQIQWKKFPWKTFVIGGAEEGETLEEAVQREIREETGYQNIKSVKRVTQELRSEWYAPHKDCNRLAYIHIFEVQLGGPEHEELTSEEQTIHEVVWVPRKTMPTFKPVTEMPFVLDFYARGESAYPGEGFLINSGKFTGLSSSEAKKKITEAVGGQLKTNYKLRDWVFSRQRYWGEPIPLVFCEACAKNKKFENKGEELNPGWIADEKLPLELPKVKKYEPTDTGESPLASIEKWVKTKCPRCGGVARRETDTMPNWAGSSWYFLRYLDPKNNKDFFKTPSFNFRSAIRPTEKDQNYFAEFKKLYTKTKEQNIWIWTVNRLLLNGLNRELWLPLRTVAFMAFEKDIPALAKMLESDGYKMTAQEKWGHEFTKGDIRAEIVPIFMDNKGIYSFTPKGARQELIYTDLPANEFGNLFGFSYRTVAPSYNLAHYEYIEKHETRPGHGDQEKIAFLKEWVNAKNPKMLYWNQVDWYNGGMEHTVLHLLYSRFWNQFLYDIGVVPIREPYKKRTSHGMILGPDGEKMSKSRGNVINPDDMVAQFGTDAFRMYIMFMGPFDQAVMWDTNGLVGVRRFLDRVWNLQEYLTDGDNTQVVMHQTIKKVSEDIDKMGFNTAIAKMMELANHFSKEQKISREEYSIFAKLISPFAPHFAEEIWTSVLGNKKSLAYESWPTFNPALTVENKVTIGVQVNGKVRDSIEIAADATEDSVKALVLASEKVQKWLEGKTPKKVIYIKGKLVSVVV